MNRKQENHLKTFNNELLNSQREKYLKEFADDVLNYMRNNYSFSEDDYKFMINYLCDSLNKQ